MKARLQPPRERLHSCKRSMSSIIRVALMVNSSLPLRERRRAKKTSQFERNGGGWPLLRSIFRPPSRTRPSLPVPSYGNFYDLIYGVLLLSMRPIGACIRCSFSCCDDPNRQAPEYLQRLAPAARGNLLTELERLELCGAEIPGAASIMEVLRAEFRAN